MLVVLFLFSALLTGCGGGDQTGNGSEQDGAVKGEKGNAPEKKIALGTVALVKPEAERFTVRPNTDEQGKKPMAFKLTKKARIRFGGKEAKLEDMKRGQQAQVEYVVRNDRNRARSVKLFEGARGSGDDQGGEKTG